ncbi:hypothetical protein BDZ45DRAFT_449576 [Acephala macrosclerotiorum]|nr:hypothetical protein BDZ45DRAFT_449576 [Acephala macrosclerotiorum]
MADITITASPTTLISSLLVHALSTTSTSFSSNGPKYPTFPTPTIPADSAIQASYLWARYMWPIIIGAVAGAIVVGCIIYFLWRSILSCFYYFFRGLGCFLYTILEGFGWIVTKLRDKKEQWRGWRQKRRRAIAERKDGLRRAREQREAVQLEMKQRKRRERERREAAELERKRGVISVEAIDLA